MKLASARSSRAPAPKCTTKRAPEILAARSKSRMPSASPISQCGRAGKSNRGGSPQVLTQRLSCSDAPAGTESCGRLGIAASSSRSFRSAAAACASSCSIVSLSVELCALIWVTSPRSRFTRPNSAESALRCAFRVSTWVIAERRSSSRARKPESSEGSAPRSCSFSSTSCRLARMNAKSSISPHSRAAFPPWGRIAAVAQGYRICPLG